MPDRAGVPFAFTINPDGSSQASGGTVKGEGNLADWIDDFTQPASSSLNNYRDLGGQSAFSHGAQIKADGSGLAGAVGATDWLLSPTAFDDTNGNSRVYDSIQMMLVKIQPGSTTTNIGCVAGMKRWDVLYGTRLFVAYSGSPPGAAAALIGDTWYNGHGFQQTNVSIIGTGTEAGLKSATAFWIIAMCRAGWMKIMTLKQAGTSGSGVGGDPLGNGNDFDNSYAGPDLSAAFGGFGMLTAGGGSSNAEGGAGTWNQDQFQWSPGRVGMWIQNLDPGDRILKYRCIPLSYRTPPT